MWISGVIKKSLEMKKIYFSLCLLACFFLALTTNLQAQQESNDVIIITTTQEDGTVTVKKKRIDSGQSIQDFKDLVDLEEDGQKVKIVIKSSDNDDNSEEENVFFFKDSDSGTTIEINGAGDWQDAIQNMDLDFDEHHKDKHHKYNYNYDYDFDYDFDFQGGDEYEVVETTKTFLGVYPSSGETGVKLTGIVSNTGAERGGLERGDIMKSINDVPIKTNDDLRVELKKYNPGDVVLIEVERDGAELFLSVELTGKTSRTHRVKRDPCKVFYGVYVGSYGNGKRGVGVSGIVGGNDWPAEVAGLKKGDRIIAIDDIPVNTHKELVTERDIHEPGEHFTFTYLRDGEEFTVDAQFKECPRESGGRRRSCRRRIAGSI